MSWHWLGFCSRADAESHVRFKPNHGHTHLASVYFSNHLGVSGPSDARSRLSGFMKQRVLVPELMDDPGLEPAEHRRALMGLRRINAICQTGKHLANAILQIASERKLHSISILDLGCGSGDVATNVAKRLAGKVQFQIHGWDISKTAIASANEFHTQSNRMKLEQQKGSIEFHEADVFAPGDQTFDIVYCCLFLHHFSETQAIELLQRMRERARVAVLIDDLQRTSLGWLLAKIGCQFLSSSYVVHFDGPQSVRAAFNVYEVQELARRAGLQAIRIRKHWPERYLLRWDANP
jgi:2-polyprenyl-3-methyl-5-hydroxy-6-metoxy-1,4-benzoquinol methylase